MPKQKFDLWILSHQSAHLVRASKSQKKCRRIANRIQLADGQLIAITPVSSIAYCPLVTACNQASPPPPTQERSQP